MTLAKWKSWMTFIRATHKSWMASIRIVHKSWMTSIKAISVKTWGKSLMGWDSTEKRKKQ